MKMDMAMTQMGQKVAMSFGAKSMGTRGMRGVLGLLYAYETTWSKARWGTAANVNEAFYTAAGPPGRRGAEPISGGPK